MKYSIKIPKPCTENWNEMTPSEKGMFCGQCSKEVIDFTNYSNYGLSKLLDANEKICGRFKPEQLNTEFSSLKHNRLTSGGIALGMVSLLSLCSPIQAQDSKPTVEVSEKDFIVGMRFIEEIPEVATITGTIKDEQGALPGANIFIKGIAEGVQGDFDGNFSISIPIEKMNSEYTLVVSYIGFKDQEIEIKASQKSINIVMTEDYEDIMGEMVIVEYKRNIFSRIRNLFRKNK